MTNTVTPASLHRALKSNYRSQWDEGRDEVCQKMLAELVGTVGLERTTAAVYGMIAKEPFFTEATLRTYIPDATTGPKRCQACQKTDGFIEFIKQGQSTDRWYVYTKKCSHDSKCLKCSDTGWFKKYGFPGNLPEHFEACNCVAGDRFQPRAETSTDKKLRAAGE